MENSFSTQFNALYGKHLERGHYKDTLMALSWPGQWNGRRYPLTSLETMSQQISALTSNGKDVYFRISPLINRTYGPKERGGAGDGAGIPAIYLDLDTLDGVHKPFLGEQAGLKHPTREEAVELAFKIAEPSLVVASGGGLHVYYNLAEPLKVPMVDRAGRQTIDQGSFEHQLLERFDQHALELSHASGFGMDQGICKDTARVLRVAGTQNFKNPASPKPVEILHCNPDAEYTTEQLDAMLPQLPERKARRSTLSADLRANPDAVERVRKARSKRENRFIEAVPVSFLMEEIWCMQPLWRDGWILPQEDGFFTSETAHAKTIKTKNEKVEMVVAYGARLQEAWQVQDFRTALTSWDLLVVAVNGDEDAAALIAETFPAPDDSLIEAIQMCAEHLTPSA